MDQNNYVNVNGYKSSYGSVRNGIKIREGRLDIGVSP